MNEWLTTKEAAEILEISVRACNKNRRSGKYVSIIFHGKGGDQYKILLSSLPPHAQQQYLSSFISNSSNHTQDRNGTAVVAVSPVPSSFSLRQAESILPASTSILMVPDKFKAIALARFDLITAWQEHRGKYGTTKKLEETDLLFEKTYNMGLLLPRVYQTLGSVDIFSIKRWHRTLSNSSDWTLLVPGWHCDKREPALTNEEKQVFRECLLNPNKLSIGEATKITKVVLGKRNISSQSAPITFRRWAEWFKGKNSHIWTFMREGEKVLKDREIFSIKRDASKLQVGDVLIADGHRLNFQVINPFTGKPCRATLIGYLDWKSWNLAGYEIMVEENIQSISSALRNSIIRLGKIPQIAYQDNGKAFKAKFFTASVDFEETGFYGLFGKLGISPVFTMKYNAKAKPVERFWKEFTGKFERLLPSFTGASIEDKPAWMNMGEKFHRIHHNGYIPTISETIEMVDTWIREYFEVQPCPHVKGKTIGEVFREGQGSGVDIDELDELMMATEIKTIRANGIRFLGADYYDDVFYGLREKVFIRYSLSDLSSIKVYDREGIFLAVVKRTMAVHPMAQLLGTAKDVTEVRHLQNKQRALQKSVVKAARELISHSQNKALSPWSDIIPMTPNTIERIEEAEAAATPLPEEIRIPDYMLKANLVKEPMPVIPLSGQEHEERIAPVLNTMKQELKDDLTEDQEITGSFPVSEETPLKRPFFADGIARYKWHLQYGYPTKEDETWCEWFRTTPAYEDGFLFFERQAEKYKETGLDRAVCLRQ